MATADVISHRADHPWVPLLLSLPEPVPVTLQKSDLGLLEPMVPMYLTTMNPGSSDPLVDFQKQWEYTPGPRLLARLL